MLSSLTAVTIAYSCAAAVFAIATGIRGEPPGRQLRLAGFTVEAAVIAIACLRTIRWLGGDPVREPAVHAGYLVISVLVLPLFARHTLMPTGTGTGTGEAADPATPGDAALLALALTVGVVVQFRLLAT